MSESGAFERLTERSVEEHAKIRADLDRLREALREVAPGRSGVEAMRRVASEIEGLIERLSEHFEREEKGGLFRSLVEADARAAADVRRMSDQHARLLEILEMAGIHAARGEAADAAPLKADVEGFLAVIHSHESEEEALFRRALSG